MQVYFGLNPKAPIVNIHSMKGDVAVFRKFLDCQVASDQFFLTKRKGEFRKPMQERTQDLFREIECFYRCSNLNQRVLDSCCGTGLSTLTLACDNPSFLVVGIDKSEIRITKAANRKSAWEKKHNKKISNLLFLRADVIDLWRIMCLKGFKVGQQYLFYPNPYPRRDHFRRRWHGHPVFAQLLQCCEKLEVRSNYLPYLEEFQQAIGSCDKRSSEIRQLHNPQGLSAFELKYLNEGEILFQLRLG